MSTFTINPETFGYEYITQADEMFFQMEAISLNDESRAKSIINTCKILFEDYKDNYKYLTELVMVLNWRHWGHYEKGNTELFKVYQKLFIELNDYCLENLKDDAAEYYVNTTN